LVTYSLSIIQTKWPIEGAKQPLKGDRQPTKQKHGTAVAFKWAKRPFRGTVLDAKASWVSPDA